MHLELSVDGVFLFLSSLTRKDVDRCLRFLMSAFGRGPCVWSCFECFCCLQCVGCKTSVRECDPVNGVSCEP